MGVVLLLGQDYTHTEAVLLLCDHDYTYKGTVPLLRHGYMDKEAL